MLKTYLLLILSHLTITFIREVIQSLKQLVLEDDVTKEEMLKNHKKCLADLKKYKSALANSNFYDDEIVAMRNLL